MKKNAKARRRDEDKDAMRSEYEFSGGTRGVTAARYGPGTNVVIIDPDVLDVFPDGRAVNEALRALAPLVRGLRRSSRRRRSA